MNPAVISNITARYVGVEHPFFFFYHYREPSHFIYSEGVEVFPHLLTILNVFLIIQKLRK